MRESFTIYFLWIYFFLLSVKQDSRGPTIRNGRKEIAHEVVGVYGAFVNGVTRH